MKSITHLLTIFVLVSQVGGSVSRFSYEGVTPEEVRTMQDKVVADHPGTTYSIVDKSTFIANTPTEKPVPPAVEVKIKRESMYPPTQEFIDAFVAKEKGDSKLMNDYVAAHDAVDNANPLPAAAVTP